MNVARILSPYHLEVQRASPPEPGYGEALVRVHCVGLCGTDLELFDGSIPYLKTGLLTYPVVPGHEWTGEIYRLGAGVTHFQIGDRVTGECHLGCGECEFCAQGQPNQCPDRRRVGILGKEGACAEFLTMPARSLHPLPPNVDFHTGTLTEPLTVALYALEKVAPLTGKHVFVNGLGTIGLLTVQLLSISGASVIAGADPVLERVQLAHTWGTHLFHGSGSDLTAELLNVSPAGFDLVLDASGDPHSLQPNIALVKPGGSLSLLGLYRGQDAVLQPDLIVTKDIRLLGNMASAKVWERALNLLQSGRLDPNALITHRFPLDAAAKAFRLAIARESGVIKILLDVRSV
ncbi:alcohol dehydrogenase catalytic domain-containing protein [candidate division KSB3 bacterium]|uniref:Alcohol dehydrogenase catalytic domain-containing protein n=1 Tax=candidate division KSB3 bacterium TaxID=2044937 RepID=A0A9D5JYC3_9BACT|nr:alcohol dehydrogenase catalytic domain-containing protein [candidate division KSB3 bacterium]MBD3326574.1 alcohol dehydrogenase catalytic domain-containing protein [candidate division KSB3 bacterium]